MRELVRYLLEFPAHLLARFQPQIDDLTDLLFEHGFNRVTSLELDPRLRERGGATKTKAEERNEQLFHKPLLSKAGSR